MLKMTGFTQREEGNSSLIAKEVSHFWESPDTIVQQSSLWFLSCCSLRLPAIIKERLPSLHIPAEGLGSSR